MILDRLDIKLTKADISPTHPYGCHLWLGGFDTGLARVVEKGILFPVIHLESPLTWKGAPNKSTFILGRILLTHETIESPTNVARLSDLVYLERLAMAKRLMAVLEGSKEKGGHEIVVSFGQQNVYAGRELALNPITTTSYQLGLQTDTKAHMRKRIPILFPTNDWKVDI